MTPWEWNLTGIGLALALLLLLLVLVPLAGPGWQPVTTDRCLIPQTQA